jgi:hypothetical protein
MPTTPPPASPPPPPPGASSQVDYAAPPAPRRRPITDVPLTVVLVLAAGAVTYLMVFVAPRCESTLLNYGARVSGVTRWALKTARTIGPADWAALWAPAFVLPVLWASFRPWPPRRRTGRGGYVLLGVVLAGAVLAFFVVALIVPMIEATHTVPDR